MSKITSKTEFLYQNHKSIDELNMKSGVDLMINDQKQAILEIQKSSRSIKIAVSKILNHLKLYKDSRLIYVGAGTSGRIAVQDGVELFPTFNWPMERVEYILAGGEDAIFKAIENAEDDVYLESSSFEKKNINHQDIVIGLAASGNTPFTCKVMELSNKIKALTIAISNNPFGTILKFGRVKIILDTKEEVIAGSTRLKAGTAQKICLNIISSMVMTKIGRVKNGMMSHMVPTNEKLRKRKLLIEKNY